MLTILALITGLNMRAQDCHDINTTLPLVIITTEAAADIQDEPRIKANMGIVFRSEDEAHNCTDEFNIYNGSISIEIRGTSSQGYNKKSYALETQNADGSNNNVALLGMPDENDWILYGPYADKSLLRNVLTYHLGRLTDRYAPRTRLCELFINDEYLGVYILTEKIKQDKNRVDIAKLKSTDNAGDSLTGGYIIKVDRNEQNLPGIGWESAYPDFKLLAYVEPKASDITDPQKAYIQNYMDIFEMAMAQQDYEDSYLDFIDVDSWIDYFLITEVGKHIDAYKLSFYMYKDKDSKGGKLHLGPLWDFNFGYGNFDFSCSPDPDGWAYAFPDCGSWHPFWAQQMFDIPSLQHGIDCRWTTLRQGPLRTDRILSYLDTQALRLGPAIDRNFEKWPILGEYVWANNFIGDSYPEELDFLKTWLTQRLDWMDANMVGDCTQYVSISTTAPDAKLLLYPNPAHDFLYIHPSLIALPIATLQIINAQGQKVMIQDDHDIAEPIDIADLPQGYYILLLYGQEQQELITISRFIKR